MHNGRRTAPQTGVYRISAPTVNDLVYIGSAARSLMRRWIIHRSALSNGVHHSPRLQEVVDKHGLNVLQFDTVELCSPADCLRREQFWIDQYPTEKLYNTNRRAESRLGTKFTPAQCQKLIETHGGVASPKLRAQIVTEYAQGAKLSALAKRYKVTRGTIRNYVCRSGAALRLLPTRNEILRSEIAKAYAAGKGIKHLAKIYSLDYDTVKRILTRAGVTLRSGSARQKLRFEDVEACTRLSIVHCGRIHQFIHRTHGIFVGHAIELARQFGLSVRNMNAVAGGTRPAHKGWELLTGEPHIWRRPEHRQYLRGPDHPNAGKVFDVATRRIMARRNRKCSDTQIIEIRHLLQSGMHQAELAKRYGVTQSVISRINTGARYYAEFL
jgi:Mor family transcriptional regulator